MHKDIHCAVIIDCWMHKLGEITFENRPSKFPTFVEEVRRICSTKEFVFGLEDTRGFGRNLSAYLCNIPLPCNPDGGCVKGWKAETPGIQGVF